MERAYIAGKMSGMPAYNVFAFEAEAAKWRERGYVVVTPFDCNSEVWQRHYGRPFDPYIDKCEYGDPLLAEMLCGDVAALLSADVVVFLPGWIMSRGARMEAVIAHTAGKRMVEAESATMKQSRLTLDYVIHASVTKEETA